VEEFGSVPTIRIRKPDQPGRWRLAGIVGAVFVVLLVAKPWGTRQPPASPPFSTPTPFVEPGRAGRQYHPGLFGNYEIRPAWEIWPAGYVYRFGIAGPLTIDDGLASPGPIASPTTSGGIGRSPTPTPSATPQPTPPPGAGELVDLGPSDHLLVVALNTPADVHVTSARMWRMEPGGGRTELALIELPPPWPADYFHIYGLPPPNPGAGLGVWEPGVYRLDVTVEPEGTVRRIGLLVRPALDVVDESHPR
jgi:hypothetical protein